MIQRHSALGQDGWLVDSTEFTLSFLVPPVLSSRSILRLSLVPFVRMELALHCAVLRVSFSSMPPPIMIMDRSVAYTNGGSL